MEYEIELDWKVGDTVVVDNTPYKIEGLLIYLDKNGKVSTARAYADKRSYVSLKRKYQKKAQV